MSELLRLTSRRALVTASLVAVAGALLAPAPAAQAKSGPCTPEYPHGAQCTIWQGTVRYVDDGDTLDADVRGDGLGGLLRVRITGIQAMEQTSYRAAQRAGDCHAVDATNRLEQLVKRSKKKIRLAALYPESRSRGRRLRSIAVRSKGRWRDVGRTMIAEGHALWWPVGAENANNVRYSVLSQRAAAAHRGVFSPNSCGVGPNEGHAIKLWANWDADGNDREDVNGEWVKIKNLDPVNPLPIGGWYVRDSALRRYTFPPGAFISPNTSVTVYAGQGGEPFNGEYFWGLTAPVFENVSGDDRGMGDGAYLFDPQGDIRASMIYPCRVNCADANQGQISIDVNPRKDEIMTLRNNGAAAIDLENYQLKSNPYGYAFPPGSILQPGETMRISTQGDPDADTQFDKFWGMTSQILNNGGDSVRLVSYTDVRLACTAWGSKSC
jgi:endonuclease YncB( thermonuclease family)